MLVVRRLMAAVVMFAALPLLSAQSSATTQRTTAAKSTAKAQAAPAATTGDKLDINTATTDQLKAFNGIGDAYAKRIVDGRPYTMKTQLVSKGVLPQAAYNKIKDNIVASKVKK